MRLFPGILKRWIDGDTCIVDVDLGFYAWLHDKELRLAEWDSAEIRQLRAHPKVEKLVGLYSRDLMAKTFPAGSELVIVSNTQTRGKYGRIIGDFMADGRTWSTALLDAGLVVKESADQVEKNQEWKVIYHRLKRAGMI